MVNTNVGRANIDLTVTEDKAATAKANQSITSAVADSAKGIKKALSDIALPASLLAGVVGFISKMEEAVQQAEKLRDAGREIEESFQDAVKSATATPDETSQRSRALRERLSADLDELRKQQEQLETLSVSLKVAWSQVFGGPSREEVSESLRQTGVQLQRQLESALRVIEQREQEARDKKVQAEIDAYNRTTEKFREMREQFENDMETIRLKNQIEAEQKAREEAEKTHRMQIERQQREHDVRMRNLEEYANRLREIREQQEQGFTIFDGVIATGGGAGFDAGLRARMGRMGGGRGG